MISNSRVAVKLHKHTKTESDSSYVVVEYGSPDEAASALQAELMFKDVVLEKDYARSAKSRLGDKKEQLGYKTTVYLGNLPETVTEEDIKKNIDGQAELKRLFLAKNPTKSNRKYAFLEFVDEGHRNKAFGVLEQLKQDGVWGTDIHISPAYPNVHSKRASGRKALSS
ncbi:hypothetical protein NECID01_0484 [Nematocida sp. AWRm77]|nr:hypothetical protein NECID01_0484 [Nematocida sp. AWRm77]